MPVSGHTKYRAGLEVLGFGRVMIRASGFAFDGRTKSFEGFSGWGANEYFEAVLLDCEEALDSDGAAFVDLVLAILSLTVVRVDCGGKGGGGRKSNKRRSFCRF